MFSEFISYQPIPMTFPLVKYLALPPPIPFCIYKFNFNSSVSVPIKKKGRKKNKNVAALVRKDCKARL